ncbi:MAG: D-isomer specific 2-hydroxyacid dehydrogenase family protein [Lachnospiraceae bacterium]|nr:D-isomer specific 2-hydroxyacid dehydrogenase family protein [Lachnospiraceae bacterium]
MKVFAYSVREDEVKYVEEFKNAQNICCDYVSEYPSMDNVNLAAGYDAVSVITNVITPEMYEAWAKTGVKYLATRSVGYDHFDLAIMKKLGMRGVHATYSPNAVANYTIMMMLMACRQMPFIMYKAGCQDFSLPGKIGKELSLCTVGIIGTGQIGETVIKHLSGFGCRILAYSTSQKEEVKKYAEYVDLDTLYKECDVISLHIPGSPKNYHLIDRNAIAKMKDDVIFVNTARGNVVDSEALIEGLESGKIGFAALDTFEEEVGLYYKNLEREQLVNRTRAILSTFKNVLLTPHMAFYTEQSSSDMVRTTMRGLRSFESNEECAVRISELE